MHAGSGNTQWTFRNYPCYFPTLFQIDFTQRVRYAKKTQLLRGPYLIVVIGTWYAIVVHQLKCVRCGTAFQWEELVHESIE